MKHLVQGGHAGHVDPVDVDVDAGPPEERHDGLAVSLLGGCGLVCLVCLVWSAWCGMECGVVCCSIKSINPTNTADCVCGTLWTKAYKNFALILNTKCVGKLRQAKTH